MLVPWWEWHPTRQESATGWVFVCAPVVALMVWVGVDAAAVAGCELLLLMALSLLVYAGPREGGE